MWPRLVIRARNTWKASRFVYIKIFTNSKIVVGAVAKRFSPPIIWPFINVSVGQLLPHVTLINGLVQKVIDTKKQSAKPFDKSKADLVDRLLQDGVFSESEIKDEVMGFFLA